MLVLIPALFYLPKTFITFSNLNILSYISILLGTICSTKSIFLTKSPVDEVMLRCTVVLLWDVYSIGLHNANDILTAKCTVVDMHIDPIVACSCKWQQEE